MGHRKLVTFSFDDGTIQDRRFVRLLSERGLRATFNLNSALFGEVHEIVHNGLFTVHDEVRREEVRELYRGHEIAVHTLTHPNLLECSDAEIIRQVGDDRLSLSGLTDCPVIGMAYPGGPFYDDRVIRVITSNTPIVYARDIESTGGFSPPSDFMRWHPSAWIEDRNLFRMTEDFLAAEPTDSDLLFYVWGHSFEFDKFHSWDRLTRFLDRIAEAKDVECKTNGEVWRYLTKGET